MFTTMLKRPFSVAMSVFCTSSACIFLNGTCILTEGRVQPSDQVVELPVVDLSASEDDITQAVRKACMSHGFFYVRAHGISADLQWDMFKQSQRFFQLPVEQKMEVLWDENNRGWDPSTDDAAATLPLLSPDSHSEAVRKHLHKLTAGKRYTKESFFVGRANITAGSPECDDYMQGVNQWPSSSVAPDFQSTMQKYFGECHGLAGLLSMYIAQSLGLQRFHFSHPGYFDKPMALLRLLHYYPDASDPARGVYATKPHTDYGMLTVLALQPNAHGLQVLLENETGQEEWWSVPPREGCLVVNLGDMLHKWSGGLYRSTRHRVVQPIGAPHRYSTAFFFEPNVDCVVSTLPGFSVQANIAEGDVDGGLQHLSSSAALSSGDHLKYKTASTTYLGD